MTVTPVEDGESFLPKDLQGTPGITVIEENEAQVLAEGATGARRRLAKVRSGALSAGESRFERIEYRAPQVLADAESADEAAPQVLAEVFFVRRMRFAEITKMTLETCRTIAGALDLRENSDELRNFSIAVLTNCICASETGTAYFTLQDATEFIDSCDSEIISLTKHLIDCAIEINPLLLPKLVARPLDGDLARHQKSAPSPEPKKAITSST